MNFLLGIQSLGFSGLIYNSGENRPHDQRSKNSNTPARIQVFKEIEKKPHRVTSSKKTLQQ